MSTSATPESRRYRILAIVLGVIGLLALIVAIVYAVVPVNHLPNIPGVGYVAHATRHHTKRAIAGLVFALLCFGGAAWSLYRSRQLEY